MFVLHCLLEGERNRGFETFVVLVIDVVVDRGVFVSMSVGYSSVRVLKQGRGTGKEARKDRKTERKKETK